MEATTMSRVALILAVLGLFAFAVPAISFADSHEAGEADVAAPADGGDATEAKAPEGEEAEASEGAEEEAPK
jgi:hypothetical protein